MSEKTKTNALKIDQHILDKFWTLSESNASGVIKATDQLVDLLQRKQKQNADATEEFDYSIKRLVKGLASSRESARQGFSVALCQILRKFDSLAVEDLLSLVSKHIKQPRKESKTEEGNCYLGESLAYLTLIQSGRLFQEDGKLIKKVVRSLLSISKKRSYLHQICYSAVCLIIKEVNNEDFEQYVWPELEVTLQHGWEKCSPDTFCLLVTCRKYQSNLVNKKFLKDYWDTKKIFKEENFIKIWHVILDGASCFPVIHSVNKIVVQELVHHNCSVGQFWQAGQELVFSKSLMRPLNVGFHMLIELLPLAQTADEMKLLLSPETVKTWVKNVDGKLRDVNPLLTITKSVGSELIKVMKTCQNPDLQMTLVTCLIQTNVKPGNETTKALDVLLQWLCPEAAKDYGKYLMESLTKHSGSEDQPLGMLSPTDMVIHLRTLVTLSATATDHNWQLELLQFLLLHSYFNVIRESTSIRHCNHKFTEMPEKLRKQFQDSFHQSLTQLLNFKTESSKTSSVHAYKDTIYQLVTYIQTLIEDTKTAVLVKPLSDQAKEDWDVILKHLEEIHTKIDTSGTTLYHAFELLFLYNAIQLLTENVKDNSGLQDLIVCYKKATEKKRKSLSQKEPAWIEVMTELLLSMMSHGSTYARMVAKNVFACLTNHITPESMSLITEVLRVEKPGEEDGALDVEDDEEEEMESDMEVQDEADEKEEVNEESDSDTDTDDSESDQEIDDEFRSAIKSALGPAAVEEEEEGGSEEGEDDEDISDSEMFKLDAALSQVFKNMKKNKDKEKKETQKQLNIFKLRVLDMVEALVKIQPPADIVLDLLFPLLELMEHGQKQKENRELSNRATNIFKLLYRKAKVHSNTDVGAEKYLESIKSIIEFSKKALDRALLLHVSDACFLVVRLLLHLEMTDHGPSPIKTRSHKGQEDKSAKTEQEQEILHKEVVGILETNLKICLGKRESKLNPLFFTNIVTKSPVVCWPLTKTLLQIINSGDTKVFFKTQACSMLSGMINKTTQESVKSSNWEKFCKDVFPSVEDIIRNTEDDVKSRLMTELLLILTKLIPLSDITKLSDDIMEKLNSQKHTFNTDKRRLYNTLMGKLQSHNIVQGVKQKRKSDSDQTQVPSPKKKKKDLK